MAPTGTQRGWAAIQKSLLLSKKWRRASDDACLLYVALHLACDSYGAIEVDPEVLPLFLFPGKPEWDDPDRVTAALASLESAGLIQVAEVPGSGVWAWIVDYDEQQPAAATRRRGKRQSPISLDYAGLRWTGLDCAGLVRTQELRTKRRDNYGTNVPLSNLPPGDIDPPLDEPPKVDKDHNPERAQQRQQLLELWQLWLDLSGTNPNMLRGKAKDDRKHKLAARVKTFGAPDVRRVIEHVCQQSQWHKDNGVKPDIGKFLSSDNKMVHWLGKLEESQVQQPGSRVGIVQEIEEWRQKHANLQW